jgi:hypothetical protein
MVDSHGQVAAHLAHAVQGRRGLVDAAEAIERVRTGEGEGGLDGTAAVAAAVSSGHLVERRQRVFESLGLVQQEGVGGQGVPVGRRQLQDCCERAEARE